MALSYTGCNGLEQNCDNICLYFILLFASVFYTFYASILLMPLFSEITKKKE